MGLGLRPSIIALSHHLSDLAVMHGQRTHQLLGHLDASGLRHLAIRPQDSLRSEDVDLAPQYHQSALEKLAALRVHVGSPRASKRTKLTSYLKPLTTHAHASGPGLVARGVTHTTGRARFFFRGRPQNAF